MTSPENMHARWIRQLEKCFLCLGIECPRGKADRDKMHIRPAAHQQGRRAEIIFEPLDGMVPANVSNDGCGRVYSKYPPQPATCRPIGFESFDINPVGDVDTAFTRVSELHMAICGGRRTGNNTVRDDAGSQTHQGLEDGKPVP